MSFLIFIRLSFAAVPTLDDLASSWINPNVAVSEHAQIDANNRDLAAINNYWGALGIVPQSVRPVDMFAINSLELPPMAACGADGGVTNTYGCGGLFVNGQRVAEAATRSPTKLAVAATRWRVFTSRLRSACRSSRAA